MKRTLLQSEYFKSGTEMRLMVAQNNSIKKNYILKDEKDTAK